MLRRGVFLLSPDSIIRLYISLKEFYGELSEHGEDIPAVFVFIDHVVHGVFHHEDTQSALFALFQRQRGIGIGFCERIILLAVVDKGDLDRKRLLMYGGTTAIPVSVS